MKEIRRVMKQTIRDTPRVLINTFSGRLCDKAEQLSVFEDLSIFKELVSSMTTQLDLPRIEQVVKEYCRYVMLSHRWEENEPLFEKVVNKSIYDLEVSPENEKLRRFCSLARDTGFHWAWSDTCCINKNDNRVLQESLVAMFTWYHDSSLTLVFLRNVGKLAKPGDLRRSIWNTRAWTFQEYLASKAIRFYTEDWTPYLNLDVFNHKDVPEIVSEMEQATGAGAHQLLTLRPGFDNICEKLHLASTRETTLVEDAAYSLLGIFSVRGMPVIYGEGKEALGRLLEIVLSGSGDSSILAWTGKPSSYNSCLPDEITVFKQLATSHLPRPLTDTEMEKIVKQLRTSSLDVDLAVALYDRLHDLPSPSCFSRRLKLPCIMFPLSTIVPSPTMTPVRTYRTRIPSLGIVDIRATEDLSMLEHLYLVHPWIHDLLDREHPRSATIKDDLVPHLPLLDEGNPIFDDHITYRQLLSYEAPPHSFPLRRAPMDKQTRALRLIARLRQPFGALLLTPMREGSMEYKRVATSSMITVRVQEDADLSRLVHSARTLDVL